MNQFEEFSHKFDVNQHSICMNLCTLINMKLNSSQSKLFHGSPVWFINDNPIVGYSKKKSGISLLFWSGQTFSSKGLTPVGKYKAAEKIYKTTEEIDIDELKIWLDEAKLIQWNYKNIRNSNGELIRI